MKVSRHSNIKIIFLITTVFLLSISIFSYIRIKNLLETSRLINHTNLVKLELENIFSNLKDIESEQRGYMLTNDIGFLEHSKIAQNNLFLHLKKFDLMTKDNPSQQENLLHLRKFVTKKLENQQTITQEAEITKIGMIRWQRGKTIMNQIRVQIDKMIAEENQLLAKRSISLTQETSITPILSIFLTVSFILVLVVSYYRITKELKISNNLKENLQSRESELILANNSLLEKNESLARMNKELESFTYISSHDLQEPLRKIQTFVDRILEKEYQNLSDKGKKYLISTLNCASRMQVLIQDLLAYSRTKSEIFQLEITNLNHLLEEVKEELKEEIETNKVTIISDGLIEANINKPQFRQLMINLISNSIKFARPGIHSIIKIEGKVVRGNEITTTENVPEKEYYHICFSDNGIGFDPFYKERIFNVFQRLHSNADYPGTGIGLAIVKKIADNHKGYVTATAAENEGAVFNIYIPK